LFFSIIQEHDQSALPPLRTALFRPEGGVSACALDVFSRGGFDFWSKSSFKLSCLKKISKPGTGGFPMLNHFRIIPAISPTCLPLKGEEHSKPITNQGCQNKGSPDLFNLFL